MNPKPRHSRSRSRSRVSAALSAIAATMAVSCAPPASDVSAPSSTFSGEMRFQTDGTIALDAFVRVQLFGTEAPETYTFGGVHIDDGTFGADWTIDEVETSDTAWPVVVEGLLAFETRFVHVRAHSPGFDFIVSPTLTADVIHDGKTLRTAGLGQLDVTFDPCDAPSIDGIAEALGSTLAWSHTTLPGLVPGVWTLEIDALGRAYLGSTLFAPGTFEAVVRVFSATADGVGDVVELYGQDVAVAPGDGSGPTIATSRLKDGWLDHWISRRNAKLEEVWSRPIRRVFQIPERLQIANANGRIAVLVRPENELIVGDETLGKPNGVALLVLDEATGDVVAWKPVPGAAHVEAIGDGFIVDAPTGATGWALTGYGPDLSERFITPTAPADRLARAPDGTVWVSHAASIDQIDADGVVLRTLAAPYHQSLAPLADGTVLVGTDVGIARVAQGMDPRVATLPHPAANWCEAMASYVVASGPSGPLFAALPFIPSTPTLQSFAILGKLDP